MAETSALLRTFLYALDVWDDLEFESAYMDQPPFDTALSKIFAPESTYISNSHYAPAQKWAKAGYRLLQNSCSISQKISFAAIFPEKDKNSALFQLHFMLQNLQKNSEFIAIAHNDAGGKRLSKWLKEMGCENVDELTKYHCRAVRARVPETYSEIDAQDMYRGAHGLMTKAGIFGADKIDAGSALLLEALPEKLGGKIADFGCGYGYLAHALEDQATALYAYDNDARAIEATKANVPGASTIWWDLTEKPNDAPFDVIIMNPPFHEGKAESVALGQKMIETASLSLKKDGKLYMVANRHLPYEKILLQHFVSHKLLREEKGFKVYEAVK